jgi:hypothetical protein
MSVLLTPMGSASVNVSRAQPETTWPLLSRRKTFAEVQGFDSVNSPEPVSTPSRLKAASASSRPSDEKPKTLIVGLIDIFVILYLIVMKIESV